MDAKQFLTLTRLLKFDDESSKALGNLLKSRFPKRHIQFIIKAKPYWVSMRVEITSLRMMQPLGLCSEIRIKFLLQEDKVDRLDRILRPIFLTTGTARCKRRVAIEHEIWRHTEDDSTTLLKGKYNHTQHDYWWRF